MKLKHHKKYITFIAPSSDTEDDFQGLNFSEAYKKHQEGGKFTDVYSFDSEKERDTFIEGYLAGIGYLGNGVFINHDNI